MRPQYTDWYKPGYGEPKQDVSSPADQLASHFYSDREWARLRAQDRRQLGAVDTRKTVQVFAMGAIAVALVGWVLVLNMGEPQKGRR